MIATVLSPPISTAHRSPTTVPGPGRAAGLHPLRWRGGVVAWWSWRLLTGLAGHCPGSSGVEALTEAGVLLRSLREGIDYSTPTGRMLAGILASLAAYERELPTSPRPATTPTGC